VTSTPPFSDLEQATVADAMSPVAKTVTPTQTMDTVARMFSDCKIGSVPVVDEIGRLIGIITNNDLARFQSQLNEANSHIDHGMSFELARRESDGSLEMVPHPFDEVQRHMTAAVQTIDPLSTLRLATRIMCQQHIHHLVVINREGQPIGILSSLDILAKLDNAKKD
jgi:CBS domain-containing protein